MFDFHLHSNVSFDSQESPLKMVQRAKELGLHEICFTDHLDYDPLAQVQTQLFETDAYNAAYDSLHVDGVKIRKGFEFSLSATNAQTLKKDLQRRHFDFVIGSVHFLDDLDVYYESFWATRTTADVERRYFEQLLTCVQNHDDFDVLGHITYIGKLVNNPGARAVPYNEYVEVVDALLKAVAEKGKGLEVNTSSFDRNGAFMPSMDYLRRFKELGGQIVTVGPDAHNAERVGQYCREACAQVAEIFGYVCTFEDRKPLFHKL